MPQFYVYILTNRPNGTLYVGSTANLIKRVYEHKSKARENSFSSKYNLDKLVYYEIHESYIEAARREKRFKKWPRQWKLNLIESLNEDWLDLYLDVCC